MGLGLGEREREREKSIGDIKGGGDGKEGYRLEFWPRLGGGGGSINPVFSLLGG